MADEKTTTLRVDSKPAEQALNDVAKGAEKASGAMGELGAETTKTETNTKRLVSSSREYNSVARSVADSVQSIERFERAYQAALKDTNNTAQIKASILSQVYSRSISGAIDEQKAVQLSAAGHADAAAGVRYLVAGTNTFGAAQAEAAGKVRLSAYQMQNLSYQINDVITQLASGTSVTQTLAQQGGQIVQAFGSVRATLAAVLNPYVLLGTAVAAGAATAWMHAQSVEAVEKALRASNGTIGMSVSQMEELAQATADAGGVSVREARAIAAALASAGTVGSANARALTASMAGVAQLMGEDAVTAAAKLGAAMANPIQAATTYDGKLWNLTSAQIQHIESLDRAGRKEEAQAVLIAALTDKIAMGTKETGLWTRAVNALSNAWDRLAKGAAGPENLAERVAQAQRNLAGAQNALMNAQALANSPAEASELYGGGSGEGAVDAAKAEVLRLQAELSRLQAELARETASAAKTGEDAQARSTIKSGVAKADKLLPEMEARQALDDQAQALATARDAAAAAGDTEGYDKLSTAYEAVSRAAQTYITEGERSRLLAEAQAKASTMTAAEGQKFLAVETQRINTLGKVVSASELAAQGTATLTEANAAYSKAMVEQNKALTLAAVDSRAKIQTETLAQEREALSQRRALGEISAAEEMAQAVSIGDRQRAVEEAAARQRLEVLRRTGGVERTEIDAAERAVTELRARHQGERQKQLDEEVAARAEQARQLALIGAQQAAASGGARVDSKAENLRFAQATGQITSIREVAAQEKTIADERYQIELDLLNKKLERAKMEPTERATILNEIKALEEKHALNVQKIDHQATESRIAEAKRWVEPFKSALSSMVSAYISGTQTLKQIALNAVNSIAASYASKGLGWLLDKAATATVTGIAGQEAASALGLGKSGLEATEGAAQTTAVTANTAAVNALTIALGGNTAATGADAAASGASTAATAADTAATSGNTAATTANAISTDINSVSTDIGTASEDVNTVATESNTLQLMWSKFTGWLGFASGTSSAPKGPALVGEEGPELVVLPGGTGATLVGLGGPQIVNLGGGEVIYPADQTMGMINARYAKAARATKANIPAFAAGTAGAGWSKITAAGLGLRPTGLPAWLTEGPGQKLVQSVGDTINSNSRSTTTSNRGGDTHINLGGVTAGKGVTKEEILNLQDAVCEAVVRGIKKGNPNALYLTKKGR